MDNVEGDADDEYSQQVVNYFACGSDFILTKNAGDNLFSMGGNKCGQLGLGIKATSTKEFKVIERLLEENVRKIFAGSRSAFVTTQVQDSLSQYQHEFKEDNQVERMMVDAGDDANLGDKNKIIIKTLFNQ